MSLLPLLDAVANAGTMLWRAWWQAAVLAALVLAAQALIGRRIPPRWRHAMWMLVLVRLALPVVPRSPFSVFNLAPTQREPSSRRATEPRWSLTSRGRATSRVPCESASLLQPC